MKKLTTIPVDERSVLQPLFKTHRRDRVFIDSVLEGHHGTAVADHPTHPTAARLDCGPIAMFAGDPTSPAAKTLIDHAPIEWVTPETDAWRVVLEEIFAGRIHIIPFTTHDPSQLDEEKLRRFTGAIPEGYELHQLDASLIDEFLKTLGKHWLLGSFASKEDFLTRGIGYVISHEGAVVGGAAAAARSNRSLDIDIEIISAHRQKGLATIVGAALALECLSQGIHPQWLASNELSSRLASKLGYGRIDAYETFSISEA